MPISQSKVGIIYPPPEVRTIVDKTAAFVARNGPEFQEKIRQNEINNPKFNFLNDNDPYHAYYLHKVKEITENKGQDVSAQIPVMQKLSLTTKAQEQQTKIKEQMFIPKEPPPEFEYIIDSAPVSSLDIDLIKLTAQFVARNGRPFLTSLMSKEQRNGMFDFLKPQHSHFSYFTRLVEQYTKILVPHKDLTEKLKKEIENPFNVLKDVLYRVEWQKHQQREKAREDELIEKERVAYSQIDWHDFVVVETVDYQPNEIGNFPPPTTPEDVGALVVQQERLETTGDRGGYSASLIERIIEDESRAELPSLTTTQMMNEISLAPPVGLDHNGHEKQQISIPDKNIDEVAMDEDSDNEEDQHVTSESIQQKLSALNREKGSSATPSLPMPKSDLPLPPNPEKVIIRKDYNPKAKHTPAADTDKYFISPITGERVPASSVQEHMRISLLDPKWIEQKEKEKREKEEQEEVLAPGLSIEKQLKQLADYRRDIFGRGADETIIGKKIGEEDKRKDDKAVWDGHTATMELTSKRAMSGITLEEQIKSIHQSQGFADDDTSVKIGPTVPKPTIITGAPISTGAVISAPPQQPQAVITSYSYRLQKPVDSNSILVRPPGMPVGPMPPNPQLVRPVQLLPTSPYMPTGTIPAPVMVPQPPIVAPPPPPEPVELVEEPPMKKIKTEDQLIPEADYLERFGGPDSVVSFNVQVPSIPEKPEWNLNGQAIPFTLPLTDQVSAVKTKLSEILGMPIAKQKLQLEGMFIKDSNSLAYYNVASDSTIFLQLKERGGRKK